LPAGIFTEVWYEDLVQDLHGTMREIGERLSLLQGRDPSCAEGHRHAPETDLHELEPTESEAIDHYVHENRSKLQGYLRS